MNLAELTKLGAFVPSEPIKRKVTWRKVGEDGKTQDHTFDIYVRRVSYSDLCGALTECEPKYRNASVMALALLVGEQKERMTFEQAKTIEPSLGQLLAVEVMGLNGLGGEPKN